MAALTASTGCTGNVSDAQTQHQAPDETSSKTFPERTGESLLDAQDSAGPKEGAPPPAPSTRHLVSSQAKPQPAHVAPYEQTHLHAKVSGYLEYFGEVTHPDGTSGPVDLGDRVSRGQTLAVLSIPEMEQERLQKEALVEKAEAEVGQFRAAIEMAQAQLEAAEASVEEARAQLAKYDADLEYRKMEFERYTSLVKDRAVRQELEDEKRSQLRASEAARQAAEAAVNTSQARWRSEQAALTKSQADLVSAEARLKVARANLEHLRILLDYATIKAPYDGIIIRRWKDTGAFIPSAAHEKSQPVFTIARVDRLRIIADLPEQQAGRVRVGLSAVFQTHALQNQPLPGKVVRIAEALDPATRTMRIEVELDEPPPGLRPGMSGSLSAQYDQGSLEP